MEGMHDYFHNGELNDFTDISQKTLITKHQHIHKISLYAKGFKCIE